MYFMYMGWRMKFGMDLNNNCAIMFLTFYELKWFTERVCFFFLHIIGNKVGSWLYSSASQGFIIG